MTDDNERSTQFLERFLAEPKNEEAYGKFARKYGPRIKARCLRALCMDDNDADDLTAEILLRFFEGDQLESFVFYTKARFNAWLNRVVLRAYLDFARYRQRRIVASWSLGNGDAQEALAAVAEEVVRAVGTVCEEDRALVEAAREAVRDRVDPTTWEAFRLRADDGLSAEEAADRLDLRRNQVYVAVAKVKKLLRDEVARATGV